MNGRTLVGLLLVLFEGVVIGRCYDCPIWMYIPDNTSREDNATSHCVCGDNLRRVVKCEQSLDQLEILTCNGITFSELYNTTVVSDLLLKCAIQKRYALYYRIPKTIAASELNNFSCGAFNREGQLCGKCRSGHAPPVYSYSYVCAECDSFKSKHVLKYALVAFLPLTLFYVLVVVFKFRATDPVIHEFILYGQLISSRFNLYYNSIDLYFDHGKDSRIYKYMFSSLLGVWNLDFGRLLYKPFCLHPDLTTHQVVALDYLIAVYPLLLILLTYLLVKLHDHYRLVVIIWRPFYWCIRCIQKEWNIRASLIDVFATFLLLSNVKLLNVSFDLISVPVTLWNVTGQSLPQKYTHLNGSMEYRGKEHLPYFVLGVAVILVFNVLPILLLCLYPFRWFQKCLNCCSLSRPSLHIFMDAFQGCYKTTPRDYRHMAALPFIVRLLNFVTFFVTINRFRYSLMGIVLLVVVCVLSSTQPFRSTKQNMSSIFSLLSLACGTFLYNTASLTAYTKTYNWYMLHRLVSATVSFPLFGIIFYYVCKLYPKQWIKRVWSRFTSKSKDPPLCNLVGVLDEHLSLIP